MKEYKSSKYKYIKMNAKVGSSKNNNVKPMKVEPKRARIVNSNCGGCSRSTVQNTAKKVKRVKRV